MNDPTTPRRIPPSSDEMLVITVPFGNTLEQNGNAHEKMSDNSLDDPRALVPTGSDLIDVDQFSDSLLERAADLHH